MIVLSFEIEETMAITYSRKTIDNVMRMTYYDMALHWQKEFLPLHFKRGNTRRYNLPRRTKRHRAKKRRMAARGKVKKGGVVALVYTGRAEELFAHRHAIKAYPTRAVINMHGPRYITMRPYKSQRHAVGEEVTRTIPAEIDELESVGQEAMEQHFREAPVRQRIRRPKR